MMIHDITAMVGKHKQRKRIGRGHGSGWGKTSGRGHKGAASRAGYSRRPYFEGGQMNFARRLPKRGFTNAAFRTDYHVVNVKVLDRFDNGATIEPQMLVDAGIIRDTRMPLKVLGEGELSKKITITAHKFSASARDKIEKAGGTVNVIEQKKWMRDRSAKKQQPKSEDG